MLFSDINPYVRYARAIDVTPQSRFSTVIAPDARLFYAASGHGAITVKNQVYELRENGVIIIGAGVPYRINVPKAHVSLLAFNFDYTRNASSLSVPIAPYSESEFKDGLLTDQVKIDDRKEFCDVLYLEKITTIGKKLSSALAEYSKKLLYSDVKTGHLLAECLAECARFSSSPFSGKENEITDKILSYIHENFQLPLTNKALGEHFDYHPNYVSFLIKGATGMPLHRYLIHVRLSRAASLLENSSLPISEIAAVCGFCDTAHFSGLFKSRFGVSPSNYRGV